VESGGDRRRRYLETLERILAVQAVELRAALSQIADVIVEELAAEKVDLFVHDGAIATLVAFGVSSTPLSAKQKALGLDRQPLANGGRAVRCFTTGEPFLTGRSERDPEELPGIVGGLGVRSTVMAAFEVAGERRGVLGVTSTRPDVFDDGDLAFVQAVARWVGVVAHRAEAVERLAAQAEQEGRRAAAEELVTVVAHDLRNYLAPVQGRVQILKQRAIREGREPDRRDAEAAERSTRRLVRLVSDLLDVGRIGQGLFELERAPLELVALVREAVGALEMPDREVVLRAPEEIVLEGDPVRLRQVIDNLLSNASKHTAPGLAITVEVELRAADGGRWASLSVANPGPGIDPALASRIFTRFARGPGSEGLGLGLYLAREIARAHGGTLELETAPGRGARFYLRLPAGAHE
jgi:signal transduction histidine kinase